MPSDRFQIKSLTFPSWGYVYLAPAQTVVPGCLQPPKPPRGLPVFLTARRKEKMGSVINSLRTQRSRYLRSKENQAYKRGLKKIPNEKTKSFLIKKLLEELDRKTGKPG